MYAGIFADIRVIFDCRLFLMLVFHCCFVILLCRTSSRSWEWLNSPYAYLGCFILSVFGLLPAADKNSGYGVFNKIWCGANRQTKMALNFLVVCYLFIYICNLIMLIVFLVIIWKLRATGWDTMKRVWAGVGGYVCLTVVLWLPRIVLYRHVTSNNYFVVLNIFPNVSAFLYACLYVLYRKSLYKFEANMRDTDTKALVEEMTMSDQWGSRSHHSNSQCESENNSRLSGSLCAESFRETSIISGSGDGLHGF